MGDDTQCAIPEWSKESPLHDELWRLGFCEKEARAILDCGNAPLAVAVAAWAMRERLRELLEMDLAQVG